MIAVTVERLLVDYGYWAVVVAVGIESLGVPFPGETTLIAAGLYAGSSHRLNVVGVIVAAAAAAIVGDNIGCILGRVGGYRLLRRYGHYVRVDEAKIKVGRYLFARHGPKVVFFGRFVSILRTYAAFLAGTNKMRWRRFLVYNALGGILWAAMFGAGAYALGDTVRKVNTVVTIAGGAIAVIVVVIAAVFVRRRVSALETLAEAMFPGPLDGDRGPEAGSEQT